MIIQRRADQLEPGDILPNPRRVITSVTRLPGIGGHIVAYSASLVQHPQGVHVMPPMPPDHFEPTQSVSVEVRDLTPAQKRADEMLDLLGQVAAWVTVNHAGAMPKWGDWALAIVDQLRPKPPTLDEVLRALEEVTDAAGDEMPRASCVKRANDILNRARRTGLLKGDAK